MSDHVQMLEQRSRLARTVRSGPPPASGPAAAQKRSLRERHGNGCYYCCLAFSPDLRDATREHLVPFRDCRHNLQVNMVLACEPCNQVRDLLLVRDGEEPGRIGVVAAYAGLLMILGDDWLPMPRNRPWSWGVEVVAARWLAAQGLAEYLPSGRRCCRRCRRTQAGAKAAGALERAADPVVTLLAHVSAVRLTRS